MKQLFRTIALVATIAVPMLASAASWNIDPKHSNISFKVMRPITINTNVRKRDDHLRSVDFFDVTKYPTMTGHC